VENSKDSTVVCSKKDCDFKKKKPSSRPNRHCESEPSEGEATPTTKIAASLVRSLLAMTKTKSLNAMTFFNCDFDCYPFAGAGTMAGLGMSSSGTSTL